jgi:hypothetical protein
MGQVCCRPYATLLCIDTLLNPLCCCSNFNSAAAAHDFAVAAVAANDHRSARESESARRQPAASAYCPASPPSPLPHRDLFASPGWDLVFPSSHDACGSDCDCRGAEACWGAVEGAGGRCIMAQGVCEVGGGYVRNLFERIVVISTSAAGGD